MSLNRKKVLFISPHAGIWAHALPESYLAKCLNPDLFQVNRIKCDGTFRKHCTVMASIPIAIDQKESRKDSICRQCIKNSDMLSTAYNSRDFLISDHLTNDDFVEVGRIVSDLNKIKIHEFTYLGVEVGKIAAYEMLIRFKKTSVEFTDDQFVYFETYFINSLLSLMAFSRIYNLLQPDIIVAYSPQYTVLGVCACYSELKGKQVYFIEGSSNIGERYSALRVWDWTEFGLTNPALKYWENIDTYTLLSTDYARVDKHISRLLDSSSFSVYSKAASNKFNLHAHFNIPMESKVVLAAMSSYDEVYAAFWIGRFPANKYHSNVFKNQLEWIKETIKFFSEHPELYFIIRIHPRTYPTKRNSVMAMEQIELSRILEELPVNVRVNLPADNISIYDLLPQIDVLTTGWSATGVEAMIYNIPVVTYDKNLPSYPASIHYTGDNRTDYYKNLINAAMQNKGVAVAENVRRWLAFSMSLGVVSHPPMIFDMECIRGNKILHYMYRILRRVSPRILQCIDLIYQPDVEYAEAKRLNKLFEKGLKSLYDLEKY